MRPSVRCRRDHALHLPRTGAMRRSTRAAMDLHVGRALVVQKSRERATGTFKQAGGLRAVLGGAERQLAEPLLLELEVEQPGAFFKDGAQGQGQNLDSPRR